jgi:glycosyltransferase involved in cell wall biosynthesis
MQDAQSVDRGVEVVGFVPDLVQELDATRVVVAPIWFGGGTRIKVLEALAAARPVVGPPAAVERIGFKDGEHGFVAEDPESFGRAIVRVLADDELAARLGTTARALGLAYRWSNCVQPAIDLYTQVTRNAFIGS